MICPNCKTENRNDRPECYHCGQDLMALQLMLNKARDHYNHALEHAEREREDEAIAELKHALGIDASFVEAWVVLGTIHSRNERMEEAREAFRKALSLDPRFERAHEYLQKTERVAGALPAIRRFRATTVALSALLAVAVIGAAISMTRATRAARNPTFEALRGAVEDFEMNRGARAIERIEGSAGRLGAPQSERDLAEFVVAMIEGDLERRILEIDRPGPDGAPRDFEATIAAIGEVAALAPPERFMRRLKLIRDRAVERQLALASERMAQGDFAGAFAVKRSLEELHVHHDPVFEERFERFNDEIAKGAVAAGARAVAGYEDGRLDYPSLTAELDRLIAAAPDGAVSAALEGMLSDARRSRRVARLTEYLSEIDAAPTTVEAARAADRGSAELPDAAGEIESRLLERLGGQAEVHATFLDSAAAAGDLDQARREIERLRRLYEEVGRVAPVELARRATETLAAAEIRTTFERIVADFDRGEWLAVVDATEDLGQNGPWGDEQLRRLERMRSDSISVFALEFQRWIDDGENQKRVNSEKITEANARRLVERYRLYLANLPVPSEVNFRTAAMLHYAAWGWVRLKQFDRARELVERLDAEHANSQVRGWPSMRDLRRRLDGVDG
jgi:tetratricopeptide (TPR) repeat protein